MASTRRSSPDGNPRLRQLPDRPRCAPHHDGAPLRRSIDRPRGGTGEQVGLCVRHEECALHDGTTSILYGRLLFLPGLTPATCASLEPTMCPLGTRAAKCLRGKETLSRALAPSAILRGLRYLRRPLRRTASHGHSSWWATRLRMEWITATRARRNVQQWSPTQCIAAVLFMAVACSLGAFASGVVGKEGCAQYVGTEAAPMDLSRSRRPQDLQAALSPRVLPCVRSVSVVNDMVLDPLAFVPPLSLGRNLTICGSPAGVVLEGAEQFEMLRLNATLTLCNLTLDLSFRPPSAVRAVHTLFLYVEAGGRLQYTNTIFRLEPRTFKQVLTLLERQEGGKIVRSGVRESAWIEFLSAGKEELRNVTILSWTATIRKPTVAHRMAELADLVRLGEAGSEGNTSVDLVVEANFTFSQCTLDKYNNGESFRVRRPLTLRGAGARDGQLWMTTPPEGDASRPILQLQDQLRFVSLNFLHDDVSSGPPCTDTDCCKHPEELLSSVFQNHSLMYFWTDAPGCHAVAKDAWLEYSNEFIVRSIILGVYKQSCSPLSQVLENAFELFEAVKIDDTTLRVDRFMGHGLCMQNVTFTSRKFSIENNLVPLCPRVGRSWNAAAAGLGVVVVYMVASVLVCVGWIHSRRRHRFVDVLAGQQRQPLATGASTIEGDVEMQEQQPRLEEADLTALVVQLKRKISDETIAIDDPIGSGGYGTVYQGTWQGMIVAIKTVVFRDDHNKQRQRAIREAAISTGVAHENVVQTYTHSIKRLEASECREHSEQERMRPSDRVVADTGAVWKLYIVQELCDLGSLKQSIDNGLFWNQSTGLPDLGAIVKIALDTARGMAHLHQHNIVHGDLSAKNVLLKRNLREGESGTCTAKIADFGLSVKLDGGQDCVSNGKVGTRSYMAPELKEKGTLSKSADVYSFGVVMWELYHSKSLEYPFRHFPKICPLPFFGLCWMCTSHSPQDRPHFDLIVVVLSKLHQNLLDGQYNDIDGDPQANEEILKGPSHIRFHEVLKLILEQVGIPEDKPEVQEFLEVQATPYPVDSSLEPVTATPAAGVGASVVVSGASNELTRHSHTTANSEGLSILTFSASATGGSRK